jgi:hypothetical protein
MLEGMGRFHPQLRRPVDARQSEFATTPAVRLAAARRVRAGWGLPRLDARVPLELTPHRLASANATVARFLLEAKAARERDIPATWNDEQAEFCDVMGEIFFDLGEPRAMRAWHARCAVASRQFASSTT